ncbi:MAG TPA: YbjN domain-containing protein [Phenylobacterium sp.]
MAAAACVLAGSASAAGLPGGGMTARELQAWLTESGYEAELDRGEDGDPYLKAVADGVNFEVHLYDCKGERCASMQLTAGFDVDGKIGVDRANGWNTENRYLDCYVDDEGDPWFTYDINLSPGGTREALDDNFAIWLSFVPDMKAMAGW